MKRIIVGILAFCLLNYTFAKDVIPGVYISENGWGELNIKKEKNKTMFDLSSMGANGHSCSLDGVIINNKASLATMENEPNCIVSFTNNESSIDVDSDRLTSSKSNCSYFCGMRASFDGNYKKVSERCSIKEMKKTRNVFLKLYKSKKYDEAINKLRPILDNCESTLFWLEKASVLNDLAIAYYNSGDIDNCNKVLEPLKEDSKLTEEDIREKYPPSDADNYMVFLKATKTNLKLCYKK